MPTAYNFGSSKKGRVLVAMSGGVDSSVAAALLVEPPFATHFPNLQLPASQSESHLHATPAEPFVEPDAEAHFPNLQLFERQSEPHLHTTPPADLLPAVAAPAAKRIERRRTLSITET